MEEDIQKGAGCMGTPGRFDRKVVLDTNVILFDALAVNHFKKADIYIPFAVIEEIDKFKKDPGGVGRNARHFSRFMDVLRAKGSLADGIFLERSGSYVYVSPDNNLQSRAEASSLIADNLILSKALYLQTEFRKAQVELVTQDINLRIKADVMGIKALDYAPHATHAEKDENYTGIVEVLLSPEQINGFYENKHLHLPDSVPVPTANQYVWMKDSSNPEHSALGRFDEAKSVVLPLITPVQNTWGVHPRNIEQHFALDALLNDRILFVSLVGKAGTGKTLLALAAGLTCTLDDAKYQRLLISRPIFPMGRDIGYLPGDVEQKLNPWMQPIFDSIEFLMGSDKKAAGRAQELVRQGMVNIEPLTYIRGRSIPRQFLIVDEAQNLTPHEIKTIVTRAGQGTKVVLTGDYYQIDNPYVDFASSGLTYAVDRFRGQTIAAHVCLQKGERSPLAELAANLL